MSVGCGWCGRSSLCFIMPELDIAWELWEQVSPVLEGPLATGDHSKHSTPGVEELSTKVREVFTEQG